VGFLLRIGFGGVVRGNANKGYEMKLHPIKEYLDNLASCGLFRVVPETHEYIVRREHAEAILTVIKLFVQSMQNKFDVYERVEFQISDRVNDFKPDPDDAFVRIRGRYAFSEVTAAGGKGKKIKIDSSFYEVPYGGSCIDLNGRYTLLELQAIVEKATIEGGFK
jgi:hypothetical protein